MTKKQNRQTEVFKRYTSIQTRDIDEAKRQVELSFSSEEPYDRWFGPEILSHKDGAMNLTRLNEIGCLLFNHDKDKVIGRIENAWIQENRGHALVTFDEDEASDLIYQKVKSGTLKGVSVGYRVDSWEEVSTGKTSSDGSHVGPCSVALRWSPHEISIVSVPADATVGVGRDIGSSILPEQMARSEPKALYYKQLQINQNYVGGK